MDLSLGIDNGFNKYKRVLVFVISFFDFPLGNFGPAFNLAEDAFSRQPSGKQKV
ncbi:MAG TPA: hypothetical protein VE593_00240 [Nitrososphaeraceae archaeon]|nr:hypothetical protein [Nitrososphaeraceae archaeon]